MILTVRDAAMHMHARDATRWKTDLHEVMRKYMASAVIAFTKVGVPCVFADDAITVEIDDEDIDEVHEWLDEDFEAFGEDCAEHAQLMLEIMKELRHNTQH